MNSGQAQEIAGAAAAGTAPISPVAPAMDRNINLHAESGKARRRRVLHRWLERLQRCTPEFFRAGVRDVYLRQFYYRVYPEYAPARISAQQGPALWPGAMAHSTYPPMVHFKRQLCQSLRLDFAGLSVPCEAGLVSVVLPVYNGERYVREAIESVLGQSYGRFELIIVDDGSTDATPRIIEQYAAGTPVRVVNQPNRKLPAALNAGFERARGEYYTWISADNRMRPRMLSELVAFLDRERSVEMVYADEQIMDEEGRPVRDSGFCWGYQNPPGSGILARPSDPGELNFVQNNYIGGCFLYRSWAARLLGAYDEATFGFEDYEYWMRMNSLFRIAHAGIREPLYDYRLHGESLSARDEELRISQRVRYFLAVEAERRRFFIEPFDITLFGKHRWFTELAHAWRGSGHNVMHMEAPTQEALYRYQSTRTFRKAVLLSETSLPPELPGTGQKIWRASLSGTQLRWDRFELAADRACALEYPLLAAANAQLWHEMASHNATHFAHHLHV